MIYLLFFWLSTDMLKNHGHVELLERRPSSFWQNLCGLFNVLWIAIIFDSFAISVLPKNIDLQVRLHTRDDVSLLQGLRKWHAWQLWSRVENGSRKTRKRWETVSDTQKLDGWNTLKYVETTLQLWPEYTKPGSKHIQTIQVKRTKFIPNLRVSELQLDRLKSPVDSCKWLYRMPYPVYLFKRI